MRKGESNARKKEVESQIWEGRRKEGRKCDAPQEEWHAAVG